MADSETQGPFRYHLELTPAQLKITYTALHSLLDDFGHEEADVLAVIHEVLGKLPDEHAIRAISLETELDRPVERKLHEVSSEPDDSEGPSGSGPPSAA